MLSQSFLGAKNKQNCRHLALTRGGLAPAWSRESGAQPGSVEGWVSRPRTQRLRASGNISFSGGPPQAGGRRVKRPGPNVQTGQGRFLWPYGLGCGDAGPPASLRESHHQPSREGGLRGLCISAPRDQRSPGLLGGRLIESVQKGGCDWKQGHQGSGGGGGRCCCGVPLPIWPVVGATSSRPAPPGINLTPGDRNPLFLIHSGIWRRRRLVTGLVRSPPGSLAPLSLWLCLAGRILQVLKTDLACSDVRTTQGWPAPLL